MPLTGVELITQERWRQQNKEGWTSEHDKQHTRGGLVMAAICYAAHYYSDLESYRAYWVNFANQNWPWEKKFWKPAQVGDMRIRDLIKAGALIAAEIDRRQNA